MLEISAVAYSQGRCCHRGQHDETSRRAADTRAVRSWPEPRCVANIAEELAHSKRPILASKETAPHEIQQLYYQLLTQGPANVGFCLRLLCNHYSVSCCAQSVDKTIVTIRGEGDTGHKLLMSSQELSRHSSPSPS